MNGKVETPHNRATNVRLRPAVASDGHALVALTRACPMQGEVTLCIDRAPDFFALSRCRGSGSTLVAEIDRKIVGCASVSRRRAYIGGRRTEMGYVGDVKVDPIYRHAGVARRMLEEIARVEEAADPATYVGTTAAGNAAVDGLLYRFAKGHPLPTLAMMTSLQLFPLFRAQVDRSFTISPAADQDEDEVAHLLDDVHKQYTFGPVFRDGGLREILARSKGMSLSDYFVARRAGRIRAVLGIWDQRDFKQTRVLSMTRRLRCLSAVMRVGARFANGASPPSLGDELKFRYARHAAHLPGERGALMALVRHALNESRERRDHFLLFTCSEKDPLRHCVAGLPRSTYRYNLVASTNRKYDEHEFHALSSSLSFDDAALA